MKVKFLKFSLLALLFITCKKETTIIAPSIYQVDKEFKGYVATFILEANLRNIKIDTTNLILTSAKATSKLFETCGTCTQTIKRPEYQKTIEINSNNSVCWQLATYNAKEALVFHELGHCLLGRTNHRTDTFPDGTPKSIMFPDNTDLYSPCVYAIDDTNNCNKIERRKYYLDELFNTNAVAPSWAK